MGATVGTGGTGGSFGGGCAATRIGTGGGGGGGYFAGGGGGSGAVNSMGTSAGGGGGGGGSSFATPTGTGTSYGPSTMGTANHNGQVTISYSPPGPSLTIGKSHSGSLVRGQSGSYTLTVGNDGIDATDGTVVTVTDTLPAGLSATSLSGTGWTCTLATLTCTRSDVLASGGSYPALTLAVNVACTASGQVTNTASATGGGDTATHTATDPTAITGACPPTLAIGKSHSGSFARGQSGSYTLTVGNDGTGATDGTVVTVTDTLPAGLSATSLSGTGWTCTLATLTCTRSDVLASGGSYPALTLAVNVACTASGQVTNTASATGGGDTATHTATDPTAITGACPPTLAIGKSHSGSFARGQSGSYTLTVGNDGTGATDGTVVTVTDTLPAGLSATSLSGTGWTCTLATLTCTRSDVLASGGSYPALTLAVNVACTASGQVTNTASATGGGDTATHTATDPTAITGACPPTLAISKTHSGAFGQGKRGTYSITVTNRGTGPTDGTTVTLTETLPKGLTPVSLSGTGWACSRSTLTCTRSDVLPSGSSYPPITLKVDVSCKAPSTVTNTATVTGGGDTTTHTATDPTKIKRHQHDKHCDHHDHW
ncbi:DUF11 domain-containing protein [Streptomyces sp. S1A1-7]|uniref:DUF11 domain-containing protein n=1 Tax=Streptomyces sp. S1A1-7 TaxID=2594459 RepID=UPI001162CB51|nr:DUF11 domain-containing protein [Streptomyces sp. S1A1-7]QDN74820.1 DUF11 domain-containing protein [Streptomyces sp. S1A1-7]